MKHKGKIFNVFKISILFLSIGFLADKLINFEYWSELRHSFHYFNTTRFLLLLTVMLLMPINWLLEVKKWQTITTKTCPLSFSVALKSVLSGLSTGYVTPNRIGEFAGRILFLPQQYRVTGTLLSLVNGFTQNMVIALLGGVSAFFYFFEYNANTNTEILIWYALLFVVVGVVVLFFLPLFLQKVENRQWIKSPNIKKMVEAILLYRVYDLIKILSWSLIRFTVFNLQFYLLLSFFGIELSFYHGLISIPTMYLLVTLTPSFVFSEPIVRGAYSVFVLGVFSTNQIGIILTGITLWTINFILPLLAGIFITTTLKKVL